MSRFAEPQHPIFRQLNASIGFDWRLGPYDVEQSRAHAAMLAAAGIIADADRDALLGGLDRVEAEFDGGTFRFAPDDEDIHMAIERRLTEIVGPVGGKLHTARSRNDQVATDMAMFTRAHAQAAAEGIRGLMRALIGAAERHLDWRMPGYTHLQRAQQPPRALRSAGVRRVVRRGRRVQERGRAIALRAGGVQPQLAAPGAGRAHRPGGRGIRVRRLSEAAVARALTEHGA